MTGAARQFAIVFDRIGLSVIEQLAGLPEEMLNRSMPLPEANSLFALATHLVGAGEFWVLALAGGRTIQRDRPAEFRATGSLDQLKDRYTRWLAAVHEVLDQMPAPRLDELAEPPAAYRGSLGDTPLTVRDCLLHSVEHSALHQGHIEITKQLLSQGG